MVKSAKNRHHNRRLLRKYKKEMKAHGYDREISFGEVAKKDPFDCGNPQCGVCHRNRKVSGLERRLPSLRQIVEELYRDY